MRQMNPKRISQAKMAPLAVTHKIIKARTPMPFIRQSQRIIRKMKKEKKLLKQARKRSKRHVRMQLGRRMKSICKKNWSWRNKIN